MKRSLFLSIAQLGCLLATGLWLVSCTKDSVLEVSAPATATVQLTPEQLLAKGKQVYLTNCTACHNNDIHKDGPIGPAVAGSSLELLRTRVLTATYPEGYKPKRDSRSMAAIPHLKDDIEALHKYLNQ